jgi:hypothetical protein
MTYYQEKEGGVMAENKKDSESREFLEHLTEFLGHSEDQSTSEVKAELRDMTVDIDNILVRTKAMIDDAIALKELEWIEEAKKIKDSMQIQIDSIEVRVPEDKQTIINKINEFMNPGPRQKQAMAFFRDFEKMSSDDLRQLYKDYIMLMHMQESDAEDE